MLLASRDPLPVAPYNRGFTLPLALLEQYPALQRLQWDDVPHDELGGDEAASGRIGGALSDAKLLR